MLQTKSRLDLTTENALSQIVSTTKVSSHQAGWQNCALEHFYNQAIEVPECTFAHHVIIVHFRAEASLERKLDERYRQESVKVKDIVIVPADASFGVKPRHEAEGLFLSLAPELINSVADDLTAVNYIELIPSFAQSDPLIYQIAIALKQELETDYYGCSVYAESLVNSLAIHLLRHYACVKPKFSQYYKGLPKYKLKQAVEYIDAHLDEKITIYDLAQAVNISQYYFCHLFKQSTGISPYQYIIRQRVAQAKKFLTQKELPLVEIALECGFSSQSQMTQHFRKLVGATPKVYRNTL